MKRLLAGLLLFVGFIILVLSIIFRILQIVELGTPTDSLERAILDELYLVLFLDIVFAMIVLVGAMSALAAWKWGVALGGAIICALSMGIFFTATICGVIAVILIYLGKDEFQPRIIYVDERGHRIGGQPAYHGGAGYDEGYYDAGSGGYADYGAQEQYAQPQAQSNAPPITLVDQYGKAEDHYYSEDQGKWK